MPSTIRVGTSGWTYDDWQGRFYPDRVKGAERLAYYVEQFDTVEVNATFYRMPTANMVLAWNRRLPEDFHLVLKGPRRVTHLRQLVDCEQVQSAFLSMAHQLHTLQVILWQLPPSLHKDIGRLEAFLSGLPPSMKHAVEFRHASWWDDDTFDCLKRHRAAFVAVSHPRLPADAPATAGFLYVRFHGLGAELYRYHYSERELSDWVERLRPLLDRRALYAFFNNDYEAHAVGNARTFRDLLHS
jgi:uncharacterized protein YecE (DUF72 family)